MSDIIAINKVVRIGTIPQQWSGCKSRHSVFVHIEGPDKFNRDPHISFTGVIGPRSSGNATGGCGHIDRELSHRDRESDDARYSNPIEPSDFTWAVGWNADLWLDVLDLWQRYHLELFRTVPAEVIAFIEALPDADRAPAWA